MAFINLKNLRNNNTQLAWFFLDILMVGLAFLNINLIVFDFTFSYHLGAEFYFKFFPRLASWYQSKIHQNFILIDLAFVLFFSLEFLLRWAVSVYQKEYYKWFFFPFARWYDLLGLIPIGSFRFLRVLRLVSIFIRLQNMKVINIKESSFYPAIKRYSSVLVEEVSDRVVINVLDGVQSELDGGDFTKEIVNKVLRPNNTMMVNFMMKRVQFITQDVLKNHQKEIKDYLFDKVNEAVSENTEMKMIQRVPGLGTIIRKQLDHAIADITYKVISGIVEDIAEGDDVFTKEIAGISDVIMDTLATDEELEEMVKTISKQTIEILKKQVDKQKWKEKSV